MLILVLKHDTISPKHLSLFQYLTRVEDGPARVYPLVRFTDVFYSSRAKITLKTRYFKRLETEKLVVKKAKKTGEVEPIMPQH